MDKLSNTTQCLLNRPMLWAFQKSTTNARCFQKAYNRPLSGFFETSINQTISQIWGKLCLAFLYYCSFWLRPRFEEAPPSNLIFFGALKIRSIIFFDGFETCPSGSNRVTWQAQGSLTPSDLVFIRPLRFFFFFSWGVACMFSWWRLKPDAQGARGWWHGKPRGAWPPQTWHRAGQVGD